MILAKQSDLSAKMNTILICLNYLKGCCFLCEDVRHKITFSATIFSAVKNSQ